MNQATPSLVRRFVPEIESLRGIAALAVAITHAMIAFRYGAVAEIWMLSPWQVADFEQFTVMLFLLLSNGAAAVTVFFVLSGVVLGMSLEGKVAVRGWVLWRDFVITRLARIYPSVWAVLLFIALCHLFWFPLPQFAAASSWYGWWYHEDLGGGLFFKNALLWDQSLNPVAWTLAVEVLAALLFPLLYKFSRLLSGVINAGVLTGLVALAFWFPSNLLCAHLYQFYLGLLIPYYAQHSGWRSLYGGGQLCLALVLLCVARALLGFSSTWAVLLESLAAAVLVANVCAELSLPPIAKRCLRFSWVRWLGRISYSFYLWHFVLLYLLAGVLFRNVEAAVIQAYTLFFALGLALCSVLLACFWAHWMYRWVERPGMNLGRWLVAKCNGVR